MNGRLRPLLSEGMSAGLNMAVDEALLQGIQEGSSPPTLRVYSFSPVAVTIGRFQNLSAGVRKRLADLDVAVVRRPTGGRAVVHGSDLAYSVVAAVDDPVLGGSIRETYRKISERLRLALSNMGVDVCFEPVRGSSNYQRSPSCFDASVLYELRIGGEKVAGGAQTRRGNVFLQQGTIALAPASIDYALLFGDWVKEPGGLLAACGRTVTFRGLATQVFSAFGVEGRHSALSPSELSRAEALLGKYDSREWNQLGENPYATSSYKAKYRSIRC